MKTATLPAVRVEPVLRDQLQAVLQPDETLSAFVEQSVREAVQRRAMQHEFVARGLAAIDAVKAGARAVPAEAALARLQERLQRAQQAAATTRKA